jgi:hypothetical protein
MSHNSNPNDDTSGFNYPSAAGVPTNLDQTVGIAPTANSSSTESSSSVYTTQTTPLPNTQIDPNQGKLGGEHGGAGTRNDDRKDEYVTDTGDTTSPVATHNRKQQ